MVPVVMWTVAVVMGTYSEYVKHFHSKQHGQLNSLPIKKSMCFDRYLTIIKYAVSVFDLVFKI